MSEVCPNCSAQLVGHYCHDCGQRRIDGRLTVLAFLVDVRKRVFRFDKAFATTFWGLIRSPAAVVVDFLEGRRGRILDPIHYFISTVFVQFVLAALVRAVAPMIGRDSALAWLARLGGVVAIKVLVIFWMASLWRLLFKPQRYNLAEIYVFATYAFGTTGLLLAALPLIDLSVPTPLGDNPIVVSSVALAIEWAYISYAVCQFARLPAWQSVLRVGVVLTLGYGALTAAVGVERILGLLQPPMASG